MKKSIKQLISLGLVGVMTMGLAACSSTPSTTTSSVTETSTAVSETASEATAEATTTESTGSALTDPVTLTFAAQEVGTGAYTIAAALQTAMLKGLPAGSSIDLTTNSPGGVGAPVLVNGGEECDIIVANAGPSLWSYEKSADEYEFGGCTDIATLGGGLGHTFTNVLFTQKFVDETGYTSLEDVIADKYPIKLITKKNGSLGELTAERVIEACGISVEEFLEFATWEKTGGDAIKSGLQDDLYEMTIDHVEAGQSNTTELCLTHDMYCVQLSDATLKNMEAMGYAPITIEPGTWNKQDTAIQSMGSQQNILVPADMDEEVAYALTKAVCENKEDLAAAVAAMSYFDPATAGSKAFAGCPLHPGAIRYYKEMGYACE